MDEKGKEIGKRIVALDYDKNNEIIHTFIFILKDGKEYAIF